MFSVIIIYNYMFYWVVSSLIFAPLFRLFYFLEFIQCLAYGLTCSRHSVNIFQMNEWMISLNSDGTAQSSILGTEILLSTGQHILHPSNIGDKWHVCENSCVIFTTVIITSHLAHYHYTTIILPLKKLQVSHHLLPRSLGSLKVRAVCSFLHDLFFGA